MDLRSAAPWGLKDIASDEEFARRYRARLHRYTPRILGQLEEMRAQYPGVPLILMCFERRPADCHRAVLAKWLEQRLGTSVPEYGESGLWG